MSWLRCARLCISLLSSCRAALAFLKAIMASSDRIASSFVAPIIRCKRVMSSCSSAEISLLTVSSNWVTRVRALEYHSLKPSLITSSSCIRFVSCALLSLSSEIQASNCSVRADLASNILVWFNPSRFSAMRFICLCSSHMAACLDLNSDRFTSRSSTSETWRQLYS